MININKSKVLITLSLVCFSFFTALAQGPSFDDDVEDVPVDGGVSLLVAAGVGYGAKKLNDVRNKKKEKSDIDA